MTSTEFRQRREALGYTLRSLAEVLGVHYMTVHKWEAGDHRVPQAVAMVMERLEPRQPTQMR